MHDPCCSSRGKRACGDGVQSTLGRGPDEGLIAPRQLPVNKTVSVKGHAAHVTITMSPKPAWK